MSLNHLILPASPYQTEMCASLFLIPDNPKASDVSKLLVSLPHLCHACELGTLCPLAVLGT